MPSPTVGAIRAFLISLGLTLVIAWPVWWLPRTQIFGHEIVGRHYDPFVVMQQFATGSSIGAYRQPLTDDLGVAVARLVGPVAAYNLLVLVSFPWAAVTTYMLARYLIRSHGGALAAALAFAFAPVHLAQASYHIHIAQVQWIPLFLLALFRAVDLPTAMRVGVLALCGGALALSNAYGALIGAVVSPVALGAYWLSRDGRRWQSLLGPLAGLMLLAILAGVLIEWRVPEIIHAPQRFAFPPEDLARYGARWWAYFVPPVDHPLLGTIASGLARRSDVGVGLLEQQVSLGWGLSALALLGILLAVRPSARSEDRRLVLVIAAVGAWAFFASLAPTIPGCSPSSLLPACLVSPLAPMFRAYARFGIVTNLCVAILAAWLVARVSTLARDPRTIMTWLVAVALTCATVEAWPLPGRARDVLPTAAHRWLTARPAPVRTLDCIPSTIADSTLPWLMHQDIQQLQPSMFDSCAEPGAVDKLAALGFTYVIVRASPSTPYPSESPKGLVLAASFPEARVYEVGARPPVATVAMAGFYRWERDQQKWWRWMGPVGTWTVVNTTAESLRASLVVTLESFQMPREISVTIDGRPVSSIAVPVAPGEQTLGPIEFSPGPHEVQFRSREPALRPQDVLGTSDSRPLTVALHRWSWRQAGQ